jgi:signal transduction histidine kinase
MKIGVGTPRVLARPMQYLTSATAVVIAVGLVGSVLAAVNASQVSKDLILSRAVTAARAFSGAFSGEELVALQGNSKDLDNDTYKSLKRRLVSIRQGNTGTRFTYLLRLKDNNQVIFLADSEPETSQDYSPPGAPYLEATGLLKSVFYNIEPIIEGPVTDSYGSWVSGLAPVTDDSGKIVGVLGIDIPARDYYQQIATYAAIPLLLAAIPVAVLVYNRRLARKEHEITQLKSQFVSIASHELRSPLTGTLWGVQSLLKDKPRKDQSKILTSMYNNVASSLATVNEILDFSIFDRGKADKLQREVLDLRDVLKDVLKLHELSAEESKLGIARVGTWPKQAFTVGDHGALKRGISNIISNAIKYSPDGSKIEVALHTEGGNHIIGVRDYGIGIPKSDQKKVLTGYYRAANAAKVQAYGTGMGLWVTRLIVEQHHGRLWLESEENKGTTFFISLPAKTAEPADEPTRPTDS